jgi:hypothetical protein
MQGFAEMMAQRTGENLELAVHVEADDQPELNSFAIGIRRDQPAVTAGLTCPIAPAESKATVNF